MKRRKQLHNKCRLSCLCYNNGMVSSLSNLILGSASQNTEKPILDISATYGCLHLWTIDTHVRCTRTGSEENGGKYKRWWKKEWLAIESVTITGTTQPCTTTANKMHSWANVCIIYTDRLYTMSASRTAHKCDYNPHIRSTRDLRTWYVHSYNMVSAWADSMHTWAGVEHHSHTYVTTAHRHDRQCLLRLEF